MSDVDIPLWPLLLVCLVAGVPFFLVGTVGVTIYLARSRAAAQLTHEQRVSLLVRGQVLAVLLTVPFTFVVLFGAGAAGELVGIAWSVWRVRRIAANRAEGGT